MLNISAVVCLHLGVAWFAYRRLLRYLRFFQQEEYDGRRFFLWLARARAFDTRGTLLAVVLAVLGAMAGGVMRPWALMGGALAFAWLATRERDPLREGKIRLNLTARARRILLMAEILLAAGLLGTAWLAVDVSLWQPWFALVGLVQAIPVALVASNLALLPRELAGQKHFAIEARGILAQVNPLVIGITGSYGKTSTKMILNEMLSLVTPTFTMDRSINTVMGITREIRTRMRLGQSHAVIEMGAYQIGSIQRLCDLTPPRAAIVTSVGIMHLERFGSPENVFQAKSELARALPADGILVCNGDNAGARRMARENPRATVLLYGFERGQPLDCWMTDVVSSEAGAAFVVHWRGRNYSGTTSLRGRPMLSNILGAFTMACALGADPRVMLAVVASVEPVDNRLQLKRIGGITELRDAYNSNPVGFAAALDELAQLPGTRKILITPGMIELGEAQSVENARVAERAASVCQLVLVVGETNRAALLAGLEKGGLRGKAVEVFPDRTAAFARLRGIQTDGDVILIENDLPDIYEVRESF